MVNTLEQLAEKMTLREMKVFLRDRCSTLFSDISQATIYRWLQVEKKGGKIPLRMRGALLYLDEPSASVSVAEWPSMDMLPSMLTYTEFTKFASGRGEATSILKKIYNTDCNVLICPSEDEALEAVRSGAVDVTLADGFKGNEDLNPLIQVRRYPSLDIFASKELLNATGE